MFELGYVFGAFGLSTLLPWNEIECLGVEKEKNERESLSKVSGSSWNLHFPLYLHVASSSSALPLSMPLRASLRQLD
jgi:hypothetical protein